MKKIDVGIILCLVVLLIGCGLLYSEIHPPYKFCESINGTFHFSGKALTCNGEKLTKYSKQTGYEGVKYYWDFEQNVSNLDWKNITINYSQLNFSGYP